MISLTTAYAQEQFHHQIGVSGSLISGVGISYHYIFSDNYRVKATGFYLSEEKSSHTSSNDVLISAGIEGQKALVKNETIRIYALLGISFFQEGSYDHGIDYSSIIYSHQKSAYVGGTGFGIELLAVGRVSFNFDVGIIYSFQERKYYTSDGTKMPPISPKYSSDISFGFGGGIGFGYQL